MKPTTLGSVLFAVLAACAGETADPAACEGGKCDGTGPGDVCEDPRYGDGVCQTSLSCAPPDIDCFTTFQDDASAATFFLSFEQLLAAEQRRDPRALVPQSDPRFVKARALLDRGWEAFRVARPVGELASSRPALVVIEDSVANAFVIPDLATDRSAFVVHVQTGLLDTGSSDDEMLSMVMHELQHAVGLHVIGNVKHEMRTFYIAEDGEPIGREQTADARAEAAGTAWRALAKDTGMFSAVELGGLPLDGPFQSVVLRAVLENALASGPPGCVPAVAMYNQLRDELLGSQDPNSGALAIDSTIPSRVTSTLAALRDQCLQTVTASLIDVLAVLHNKTPAEIKAQLPPEQVALIEGVHVIDAIAAIVAASRAEQRAIETRFEQETGRPWSALRYFSYEEDADDVAVLVLRAAGLVPDAAADFFLDLAASPSCADIVASGEVPPYGIDLADEHHATCWRVDHARRFATHTGPVSVTPRRAKPISPARRLAPTPLSERIAY